MVKPLVKPLAGVRVVDCTQVFAGPFCTYQLALLGAEVVKIEPPDRGDTLRFYRHGAGDPMGGMGGSFISINAGKRSVGLDLKHPSGKAVMEKLIAGADLLTENFRHGVMDRLGFGWERCRAINPKLVYVSLSGFGADGPLADWPAFDHTMQAMSGMMSLNGVPGAPAAKVGFPVIDSFAGYVAAFAALAALRQRDLTGEGQFVDVAMLDAALVLMTSMTTPYLNSGREPAPLGNRGYSGSPTSDLFKAGNGEISLGANTQAQYEALVEAIGAPELAEDPRFATLELRIANQQALREALEAIFGAADCEHWEERINAAGVPASKLRTVMEACAHPQLAGRDLFQPLPMSRQDSRPITVLNGGFKAGWNGASEPSPLLGEHTDEVLAALGYSAVEISRLRSEGAAS
jgi:CoA:oxalate CoA-transferase